MNNVRKSLTALALVACAWPLSAQTVAPAPAQPAASAQSVPVENRPADEDTIELSPFEVTATQDTGYQATETLAGTRIRTDLKDVGAALSVYTKEFLKDVGATDNATLLQYTTNAEVAGTRGTYAGLGNGTSVDETANLRAPGSAQRVRGLASADNTRDFFVTDIPWDSYNVDRIDIQRGPNSILFGLGSPAGIVNASTRNAEFRNLGSVEARVGSYGSLRGSLDVNQVLIPKVLAIRFDGMWKEEKFRQEPAFEDSTRYYGAIRFEPQLFKRTDFRTSIKAKYEHGEVDANRPRIVPPNDSITPWFRAVNAASLDGGMGKTSVNNGYEVGANPSAISPWLTGVGDQQQPVWVIDGDTAALQRIYGGYINTGARNNNGTLRGSGESLLGQRFSGTFYGVGSLNAYATSARLPNAQYGQYRTATLQDDSVFNFYDNLLDGPNKSEFEGWDAYNISLSQTGWDNRVAVELNYDRQKYDQGGQALITNPTLNIDVLRNFQDLVTGPSNATNAGAANPNYGRPFVQGGPGGGNSYASDREYVRASLFAELRSTDFLEKGSFLAKLLGKHRFNGVYADETYSTETRRWQMYAHSQAWAGYWNRTNGSTSNITNDRPPIGVLYLGSSLANAASAAGANIPGVGVPVGLADGKIYYFDSTWTSPAGVNFTDPWTVPANLTAIFNTGAPPAGGFTQVSNPANYVGWAGNFTENLLRYDNGANLDLLTGAQKSYRVTKSYAGSWQAFLWNDAIVPTLGWRFDEVKGKGVTALPNPASRSILNLDPTVYKFPDVFPANQIFKDHSTSGGLVVHLNKLFARDGLPLNISVSYNKSKNFQVTDTRRDIYGTPIGNPTGSTKDYGVLISTKDGKYSFRAVKYETAVANASTQSNIVGLVGNVLQQGLRFRNVFLYKLSNYPWDSREQNGDRNTWAPAYVDAQGNSVAAGNSATPPAGATLQTQAQAEAMRDASIRAWNDIQKHFEGLGYFNYWGYTPATSSALTDRSTYQATLTGNNPASQFQPNPATVFAYTYPSPQPQGLTLTSDTLSKGYEFEFTANPTRNWRISFNASKTGAVRANVGGDLLAEFITYMDAQIAGIAGEMRQFSGGYSANNQVRTNWNNARGNYTLLKLQENAAASELRKWRYNVVTNYSFREGRLKGSGVGASYRWQDKVIIGYPVLPGAGGQADFDLTKPYYGPSEDALDLWFSHERRLSNKINWKIQLNIRNALAKDGLIPISVQPDGTTWASARIAPAREWFVTNTFSF